MGAGGVVCGGSGRVDARDWRLFMKSVQSMSLLLESVGAIISGYAHQQSHEDAHLCICSSSSLIFSMFCTFLGFGFLTTTAGGFTSSRLNQFDSSELDENSFCRSSCITRAR